MSLLGFNAVGRFALGQIGQSGAIAQALTALATASSRSRVPMTAQSAVQGGITNSSRSRVATTAAASVTGRAMGQVKLRSPAGFAIAGIVKTVAATRMPGGLVISGRIAAQSELSSVLHMEIKNTPPRRALLLNSASATVSYWKGHS